MATLPVEQAVAAGQALQLHNRVELVRCAIEHGIDDEPV